jgi:peptidoglycan/LPS O-acetylase OafA/YrhL
VQAIEAAGLLGASVLAAVGAATGQSYHVSTGVALAVLGAVTAAGLGCAAAGLARARRWSQAPALIAQGLIGVVSYYLIESKRYEWGVPGLVLAVAGFVLLVVPPSLRGLGLRQPEPRAPARPGR